MAVLSRSLLWLVLVSLTAVPACTDPAPDPEAPADPLVRVDDEPPGDHCPEGGSAVHLGLDADADGVLDDGEIVSTTFVCDPEALVRVDDEAAGSNCALGGRAIHSGPDADADGALGDDEIAATVYVCHDEVATLLTRLADEPAGAPCPTGGTAILSGLDLDSDGTLDDGEVVHTDRVCDDRALTRIEVEPAGAHCAAGGAAVHSGADRDGDGALDAAEVTATEYVCDGVVFGDLVLEEPADLVGLDQIVLVTGNVRAYAEPALTTIDLPALRAIGGDLEVSSCAHLTRLSAPALATVGGGLAVASNQRLVDLDLSVLRRANAIGIEDNDALTTLDLGALTLAPAGLSILRNPIAELDLRALVGVGNLRLVHLESGSVDLPSLSIADSLAITHSELTSLSAPSLRYVRGDVIVTDDPALISFTLPVLTAIEGDLTVRRQNALTTFALPDLASVGGELNVESNPALTGLSMPRLQTVGGWLFLTSNPALASLEGLAGLRTVADQFFLYGATALDDLSQLRSLTRIGGPLQVRHSSLRRLGVPNLVETQGIWIGRAVEPNPRLETVDLPRLRHTDSLQLHEAPAAVRLDLPRLIVVWEALGVTSSSAMPTCRVDALLEQLAVTPASVQVSGTDAAASCD